MKKISIEEFKEKSNIEIVEELMKVNDGYVTSRLLTELDVHRMYLTIMKQKGLIKQVGNGIYIDSTKKVDDYYVFNLGLPNVIYSHMTALYFHGLAREPIGKYDVTVPNNYFNYHIKEHNIFYVNKDAFKIGLTEVKTPMGHTVKAYDMERCICDIINSKRRLDMDRIKYSIREYLKRKDKDIDKIYDYAEKIGIEKQVKYFLDFFL